MKKHYLLTCIFTTALFVGNCITQTIWNGPMITYTKADGVDWTLEENQDRITENVWITRTNTKGIFNIAQEAGFQGDGFENFGPSPVDTEWAFGRTSEGIENLNFMTWTIASTLFNEDNFAVPPDLVDKDMVLHLITDDIYMDIKFLSWAVGGTGGQGGFSYERATDSSSGVDDVGANRDTDFYVFPNPAFRTIQLSGMNGIRDIQIMDVDGKEVYRNNRYSGEEMNIDLLTPGLYLIHDAKGHATAFIKL